MKIQLNYETNCIGMIFAFNKHIYMCIYITTKKPESEWSGDGKPRVLMIDSRVALVIGNPAFILLTIQISQ